VVVLLLLLLLCYVFFVGLSILIVMYVPFCVSVLYCVCVNVYLTTATGLSGHFSTTLPEVFPCFFLSCKANARV
jgi:hypothetical protein